MLENILEDILDKSCHLLHKTREENSAILGGVSPLVFPLKRSDSARFSEQEARFACTAVIERMSGLYSQDVYYSVETPTEGLYSFSGTTAISASIDLSLYVPNSKHELIRRSHIECKAHNPTPTSIHKDIEKLCGEQVTNPKLECHAWFHLLKNRDSATFQSLFEKFQGGFSSIKPVRIQILFVIYVHDKDCYWKAWFNYSSAMNWHIYVSEFFDTASGNPVHSSWEKIALV